MKTNAVFMIVAKHFLAAISLNLFEWRSALQTFTIFRKRLRITKENQDFFSGLVYCFTGSTDRAYTFLSTFPLV